MLNLETLHLFKCYSGRFDFSHNLDHYGECRREDKLNKMQFPSALADGLKASAKQTPSEDFMKN